MKEDQWKGNIFQDSCFSLVDVSYVDSSNRKIELVITQPLVHNNIWTLSFDVSKSQEGATIMCVLISYKGERSFLSCILELSCTSNHYEYESFLQGLSKSIDMNVKNLKVFRDSNIVVRKVLVGGEIPHNKADHYPFRKSQLDSRTFGMAVSTGLWPRYRPKRDLNRLSSTKWKNTS